MNPPSSRRIVLTYALGALLPLMALAAIWAPELRHWHVPRVTLPQPTVSDALTQMHTPLRVELSSYDLLGLEFPEGEKLGAAADALVHGELEIENGRRVRIHPSFAREDLEIGAGSAALRIACLAVPDLWIHASRDGANPQYLQLARKYINEWLRFERTTFLPTGLQWNDHAVSERVFVLSRYLLLAKRIPGFTPEEAEQVLAYIVQSGTRLSKPGYYTYRTNHGVMQNIALLHIGVMYPTLPGSREFAALGARRFEQQLPVYFSNEGVVLEHSAGYHRLGVELLSIAARHLEAAQLPLPDLLAQHLGRAIDAYAALRRNDGTIPAWGDTKSHEPVPLAPSAANSAGDVGPLQRLSAERLQAAARSLFAPISGLAIHRADGGAVQAFVTWSDFATRAHKHRDEMALLLWAGTDVLVGAGYWPHDVPGSDAAVSWAGSNAPHFANEPTGSASSTELLAHADEPVAFLDLRRTIPTRGALRRQLLYPRADQWVVLDSDTRSGGPDSVVIWTFGPELAASYEADPRALRLRSERGAGSFNLRTYGCESGKFELLRSSRDSIAGWTALSGVVEPAWTLVRRCPPDTWAMTIISRDGSADATTLAPGQWTDAEHWTLLANGAPAYVRDGQTLQTPGSQQTMLQGDASYQVDAKEIDRRFQSLAQDYGRFKESLLPYRMKASMAVGALWLAQLLLLVPILWFAYGRSQALGTATVVGVVAAWIGVAYWLGAVYLT